MFQKFDVPDLTAHERTYINRFQQIGFWRKKFTIEERGQAAADGNLEERKQ